ncbi:hypothetical protein T484DRAFT_1858452 [Baffinella frigidus]|nr:hypothetical protein T484DRAFT_1858452 [Cryptophyta sp. CCMP2293]
MHPIVQVVSLGVRNARTPVATGQVPNPLVTLCAEVPDPMVALRAEAEVKRAGFQARRVLQDKLARSGSLPRTK